MVVYHQLNLTVFQQVTPGYFQFRFKHGELFWMEYTNSQLFLREFYDGLQVADNQKVNLGCTLETVRSRTAIVRFCTGRLTSLME